MSLHEKNYFPIQFENKVYQHNLLGHNPENQECDFKNSSLAHWIISKSLNWIPLGSSGIWVKHQVFCGEELE